MARPHEGMYSGTFLMSECAESSQFAFVHPEVWVSNVPPGGVGVQRSARRYGCPTFRPEVWVSNIPVGVQRSPTL